MSKYFATPQGFYFPDEIFPPCTAPDVPKTPLELQRVLASQLHSIAQRPLEDQVVWAQSVLHQSELYGLLPRECVTSAIAIVEQAAATNGLASYMIGNWCLFGLFGQKRDKQAAKTHYKNAIRYKNARGWYRMGVSAEEKRDWDVAVSRYESGASLRDPACLYRLAVGLLKGQLGFRQDKERAIALFEMACQRADEDFPQPLYLVGLLYMGEIDADKDMIDREKGMRYLAQAASYHFAPALVRMANAYQQSEREYDFTILLRYLHCASRQERHAIYLNRSPSFLGNVEAQLTKVLLCGSPPQFAPNEEWAYKFAVASADLGNSTAQFAVGYFSEVGIYTPVNLDFAMEMYQKSALNNCEAAKQRLVKLQLGDSGAGLKRSNSLTRTDHDVAVKRQLSSKDKDRADTIVQRMVSQADNRPPYPLGESEAPGLTPSSSTANSTATSKATSLAGSTMSIPNTISQVAARTPSPVATAPYPNTPMTRSRVSSGPVRPSMAGYPMTPVGHSRSRSVSPEAPQTKKLSYPTSPLKQGIVVPSPSQTRADSVSPTISPVPESSLEPSVSPEGTPSPSGRRSPRALFSKFRARFGSTSGGDLNSICIPPPKASDGSSAPVMRPHTFDLPQSQPPAAWGTRIKRKPTSSSLNASNTSIDLPNPIPEAKEPVLQPSPFVDARGETPPSRTPSPQRPVAFPVGTEDTPTQLKRMSATSVRRPRHSYSKSTVVESASHAGPTQSRNFSTPLKSVAEPPEFISFDQMGIQIVAEDKAGPCVIA